MNEKDSAVLLEEGIHPPYVAFPIHVPVPVRQSPCQVVLEGIGFATVLIFVGGVVNHVLM